MIRKVIVSTAAEDDITRLVSFIGGRRAAPARRVVELLRSAVFSLSDFSERGVPGDRPGSRELLVPFGQAGYVIQYRVYDRVVLIARIFHSLEDRPLA